MTSSKAMGALTSNPIAPWEKVASIAVTINSPSNVTVNVEPTAAMLSWCQPLV